MDIISTMLLSRQKSFICQDYEKMKLLPCMEKDKINELMPNVVTIVVVIVII